MWFIIAAIIALTTSIPTNLRAAEAPAAVYPKGVQEVVTGLNATVSGSEQVQKHSRSMDRFRLLRSGLLNVVRQPDLFNASTPPRLQVTNVDILCNPRGKYASLAGYRGYASSVATGITAMATPQAITTLGDAFGSIFQQYAVTIDADVNAISKLERIAVRNCVDEATKFANAYYGDFSSEPSPQAFAVVATFTAFSALVSAVSAIVTPIATNIATEADKNKRKDAIVSYFTKGSEAATRRSQVLRAMNFLAPAIANFANQKRMQALGEFSEHMSKIRAIELRLTDECRTKLNVSPENDRRAEDGFIICYAAVWKLYSDEVAAALKAAELYDDLADVIPPPGTPNPVDALRRQLAEIGRPSPTTVQDIWKSLIQIYATGNTINAALSPDNRKKAADAIDGLVKGL